MLPNKIFFPSQPVQPLGSPKTSKAPSSQESRTSFGQVLEKEVRGEIKFSKHAQQRMQSRNIELDQNDLAKLQNAMNKAREKGAKDSLILMDNLALVVSIRNNTVITAVDEESIQENVFTNIDSAVII